VKNGFVPRIPSLKKLKVTHCPFKNLAEKRASRWSESLTCRENGAMSLSHAEASLSDRIHRMDGDRAPEALHFVAMWNDKKPADVVREI
jgi:hypothetical protein